jgi:hypothetical protein
MHPCACFESRKLASDDLIVMHSREKVKARTLPGKK